MKIFIVLIFCGAFASTLAFDCSNIVVKESEGVLNWLGNVTFIVPFTTNVGWEMNAIYNQPFTGIGVWDVWGEVDSAKGLARFWNRDENAQLKAGDKFSFRFRINYGREIPHPPQLTSLRFEDVQLCR